MFWSNTRRKLNEKKFLQWIDFQSRGRKYWYEVEGKGGFKARYAKEVDEEENTIRFYQEIYDGKGVLTEIHEKYPIDKGHRKSGGNKDDNK